MIVGTHQTSLYSPCYSVYPLASSSLTRWRNSRPPATLPRMVIAETPIIIASSFHGRLHRNCSPLLIQASSFKGSAEDWRGGIYNMQLFSAHRIAIGYLPGIHEDGLDRLHLRCGFSCDTFCCFRICSDSPVVDWFVQRLFGHYHACRNVCFW